MMIHSKAPLRAAFFLVLVIALAGLPGCTSWHTQSRPVAEAVAGADEVRVTQKDQFQLVLRNPSVRGDTLEGIAGDPPRRVAVPLAEVERIEVRRVDPVRTGGVALGTALVAMTIVTLVVITTYIVVITRM